MRYDEIQQKYDELGLDKRRYKLRNAEDVKTIIGFDIKKLRGYNKLTDEDKELVEYLIVEYLNGHGLQARQREIAKSIVREPRRFKVTFEDGFSYLYDNGTIG